MSIKNIQITVIKILKIIGNIITIFLIIIGAFTICFVTDYLYFFFNSEYLQNIYLKIKPRSTLCGVIQYSHYPNKLTYIIKKEKYYRIKKIVTQELYKLKKIKEGEIICVRGIVSKDRLNNKTIIIEEIIKIIKDSSL